MKYISRLLVCLIVVVLAGLPSAANAADAQKVVLQFAARVGTRDVDCGIVYNNLGSTKTNATLSDFRLYVSNIRLLDAKGAEVPLTLDQDGAWQYKGTALLSFVGGKGCGDTAMEMLNRKVLGTVPAGTYTGIIFEIGVPFELNHLNNTTVPAPLNVAAMFWTWQAGWKFVRIDMLTGQDKLEPWVIHLGSTGCESAAAAVAPEKECAQPNRVTVRFDKFDAAKQMLVADLATLVATSDLDHHKKMPPGCMSGPEDQDCLQLIPQGFGLDLKTGVSTSPTAQKFIRVE